MEINQTQLLSQIEHLLSGIESPDEDIQKTVQTLQNEVKGLLFLALQGQVLVVEMGINMLRPQLDELVLELGSRKTWPSGEALQSSRS